MVWLKLTRPRTLPTIPAYEEDNGHPSDLLVPAHRAVSLHGRYPRAPVRVWHHLPGVCAPARYRSGSVSRRSLPEHGCGQAVRQPGRESVHGRTPVSDHTRSRDHPERLDGDARKRRDRLLARQGSALSGSSAYRSCSAPFDLIHPSNLALPVSAFSCALAPRRLSARNDADRNAWPSLLTWSHEENLSPNARSCDWIDIHLARRMRHRGSQAGLRCGDTTRRRGNRPRQLVSARPRGRC